jgi:phage terminase large subunit-like protein
MNLKGVHINADLAAAELCRRKLSFFVKEFWDTIIDDELEWAPHMDILCDEIQAVYERVFTRTDPQTDKPIRLPKLYDLIINIPPGTTKSTICTIMAPAWSWTRDASLRHITASFAESLSTGHAVKSRDIIRSDKYKRYFPHIEIKKDQDNKTDYINTANGQRYVTSVGASPTGVHAHIITVDDPLNPKEAVSEVGLENAIKFFDDTLSTRKVDKRVTPLILIMQRLHVKDPTGHLLEKKKSAIRHICLPGTISQNVKPDEYRKIYKDGFLDPVRLGPAQLAELKLDLGSYNYSGQIEQTPTPAGGIIWQKWFVEVEPWDWPKPEWGESYATDWDLAYTEKESNAASAYITTFKYRNRIYIDDLGWDWLEFPALIKWMKTKQSPHYIEAKASGKSAKQTLTDQGVIAVEVPVAGGSDKEARARMATPTAEAGMVYIKKSLADKIYHDSRQGILFFPRGQFADMADVLAQCLLRHRSATTRVMGGDPIGDEIKDLLSELDY